MSTIQYQLEKLGNHPIIGLTATPTRGDGCLLKYDVEVNPISREQAVKEGWLSPTHIHSFVDVSGHDKVNVLTDIFTAYSHQMGNTFVFVRTKKEVSAITLVLQNLGHAAVGLLNQTDKELNTILDDFSQGKWKFIVNCGKLGEGIDVRGCTDVVLGRQLGSYILTNQIIGRTTRPDSPSAVWELISPLSAGNIDSTVIVGIPESHRLVSKEGGKWIERAFNYVTHRTNKQLGIAPVKRTNRIQFT
jgi:superfamily II DNA or RNA helicase